MLPLLVAVIAFAGAFFSLGEAGNQQAVRTPGDVERDLLEQREGALAGAIRVDCRRADRQFFACTLTFDSGGDGVLRETAEVEIRADAP